MRKPKPTRAFLQSTIRVAKQQGDIRADAWVASFVQTHQPAAFHEVFVWLSSQALDWQVQEASVQSFFRSQATLPDFTDTRLLQKGLHFAEKQQSNIALMLACYALPYCYAGADGAKVLWYSSRIKDDTRKRLEETGAFVFGVLQKKAWMESTGISEAVIRILKVRLLHACIRYYTLKRHGWNTTDWGFPINQADMAGTNLAFSYIVLQGIQKTGTKIEEEEAEAFLHLWRVIGQLMGVEEAYLPQNSREAFLIANQIAKVQIRASDEGRYLTKALLHALTSAIEPGFLKPTIEAYMRYLLGDDLANMLGLAKLSFEKRLVALLPIEKIWQRSFENTPKVIV